MNIIKVSTLTAQFSIYPDARDALTQWADDAQRANWSCPHDVKERYPSASFLRDNRVVFDIKGNPYRLIVAIFYPARYVYIKFFGTHAQYDRVDAATVDAFRGPVTHRSPPCQRSNRSIPTSSTGGRSSASLSSSTSTRRRAASSATSSKCSGALIMFYERKDWEAFGKSPPREVVRYHMERLGWSQAELARRAGIQPSHLSAVLSGARALSMSQCKKLSALLKVPIDRFIENEYLEDRARTVI